MWKKNVWIVISVSIIFEKVVLVFLIDYMVYWSKFNESFDWFRVLYESCDKIIILFNFV